MHTIVLDMSNTAEPKRRGRPPSPPGVSRNHRVVTFVNDEQFEQLHKLARETRGTLSTTVYQLLCQSLNEADQTQTNAQ